MTDRVCPPPRSQPYRSRRVAPARCRSAKRDFWKVMVCSPPAHQHLCCLQLRTYSVDLVSRRALATSGSLGGGRATVSYAEPLLCHYDRCTGERGAGTTDTGSTT